jgi:hypothetical protein
MESHSTSKCNHKGENVKITKLSLVAIAAMTITTGAMADMVSNLKMDGSVKLWYETNDKNDKDMFHKDNSSGDAALTIGATADMSSLKIASKVYAVSTLGLENSIVAGARTARSDGADNEAWIGELHATGTVGKTTIKAGRMALNTPFAFTENWNVGPKTFDAIVVINKDIENVTLVGASVLRGNGVGQTTAQAVASDIAGGGTGVGVTNNNFVGGWKASKEFTKLNASLAAVHAKAGSVPINAYYYDVNDLSLSFPGTGISAYWIDASLPVGPAKLTAIYAGSQIQGASTDANDITAVALKAAGKVSGVSLLAAYSQVSEPDNVNSPLAIANVATQFKKTKLPTAGVYTDGLYVGQPGSKAFKVKAATKLAGFGVAAQYVNNTNAIQSSRETSEIDLIVSKKIGAVAVKAIVLNRTFKDTALAGAEGTHVRVITSYNF